MIDLKASLGKIARDILTLDIKTIVQPCITARAMPEPAHALLDIAQMYAAKLIDFGIDVAFFFAQPEADLPQARPATTTAADLFDNKVLTTGASTFNRLRWAAKAGIERRQNQSSRRRQMPEADEAMLQRIRRHCDQLQAVLQELAQDPRFAPMLNKTRAELVAAGPRSTKLPLSADEMTLLSKIWELGVDDIAMHTMIHIDGDVITRVQQAFATPEGEYVHHIHTRNIKLALESWGLFAETLGGFFSSLRNVIGPRWR
jgi:hypothetical protein